MGTCHVLIAPELCEALKGDLGRNNGVHVRKASDYDEGRLLVELSSFDHFSGGFHGMQAIIVEDGRVRFKAEGINHEDS